MRVTKIETGFLKENCYLIDDGSNCLVVDPGSEQEKIMLQINKMDLIVKGILITHYHFDHIGALDFFKNNFKEVPLIDFNTKGRVNIEKFSFQVVETPGHTKDSVSFYFDNDDSIFTGDFLFKETIGIMSEGSEEEMFKSLEKVKYFKTDTIVYPGHNEDTTVKHELEHNPFLKGM